MRFSTCLGLFLLVGVLLFAEHAKANLFYDSISDRLNIDPGLTRPLYLDDDVCLGLSMLAGSPLFAQPARTNSHVHPKTDGFDLGSASLFTTLAAGQISTSDSMSGSAYVDGNVGIGGRGAFKMSGGQINGDLYVRTTAKYVLSAPSQVHHIFHDATHDAPIDDALAAAGNLSDWAWIQDPTDNYTVNGQHMVLHNVDITNANQSITLAAGANERVVLSLTDFVMSAGTFTLQGTTTTTFIINIARNFSLNNAQIILSGLPPANVLFNIYGKGSQVTLDGSSIAGSGLLRGILLATRRSVRLSGNAAIYGRLFADEINLSGGARVISQ